MNKFDILNGVKIEIHRNAVAKGFWENNDLFEKINLIISENSEMLEGHRCDNWCMPEWIETYKQTKSEYGIECADSYFAFHIKNTVEDELADTIIRSLDILEFNKERLKQSNLYHTMVQFYKDMIESYKTGDDLKLAYDDAKHIITNILFWKVQAGFNFYLKLVVDTNQKPYKPMLTGSESSALSVTINEIMAFCEAMNIDIMWHIEAKMQYNLSREYKHGKQF